MTNDASLLQNSIAVDVSTIHILFKTYSLANLQAEMWTTVT